MDIKKLIEKLERVNEFINKYNPSLDRFDTDKWNELMEAFEESLNEMLEFINIYEMVKNNAPEEEVKNILMNMAAESSLGISEETIKGFEDYGVNYDEIKQKVIESKTFAKIIDALYNYIKIDCKEEKTEEDKMMLSTIDENINFLADHLAKDITKAIMADAFCGFLDKVSSEFLKKDE